MNRIQMTRSTSFVLFFAVLFLTIIVCATETAPDDFFALSDQCVACHNNLTTPSGDDISLGQSWSATMMAHSAKDPYWRAGVRREVMDHPLAKDVIEDTCATCHMPMNRWKQRQQGKKGQVLKHTQATGGAASLAQDGVSCTVCHQIEDKNLGDKASFGGGFSILAGQPQTGPKAERPIFGPFEINDGSKRIMSSATGFVPQQGKHIQEAKLCASCHTLYTHALNEKGEIEAELAEQVPYLEWLHSDYKDAQSCQECHMPVASGKHAISSVLGKKREPFTKHAFRGGNFFMQKLLVANRQGLGVTSPPAVLNQAAAQTKAHLQDSAAALKIDTQKSKIDGSTLQIVVRVENLTGHKLPTAYPSRRAWIHLTVMDADKNTVFESGKLNADGSIAGNANDEDATRFEPHYTNIDNADQVQIYESIMADPSGQVTTGLLRAASYLKDNRLLPAGFDKKTAPKDIKVQGKAADDDTFQADGDTVVYNVHLVDTKGPVHVKAELWYQPIGFRWARNLEQYDAKEPANFIAMYDGIPKQNTALMLTQAASELRTVSPQHEEQPQNPTEVEKK